MKKFFNILDKFTSNNETVAEKDVDSFDEMTLTACVLLIEVSMSDDNYDEQEKEKIIGILKTKYNLDEKQINVLMAKNETLLFSDPALDLTDDGTSMLDVAAAEANSTSE